MFLIVNANLEQQPLTFGLKFGNYGDFDSDWFKIVGNVIVGTMQFGTVWPIIDIVLYGCLRFAYRAFDKNFCGFNDPYKTKSTTLQQYIELYSGGGFYMHFKYSTIMNITFTTLMFGFGMPILFPIAILGMAILYVTEKGLLYYSYRQPPNYNSILSNSVINTL